MYFEICFTFKKERRRYIYFFRVGGQWFGSLMNILSKILRFRHLCNANLCFISLITVAMLFWLSENDGLCCFCGLGNWKQTSQSGHYCYSGLLIIAQRVSRKCLANDPFLVWYPHNKLHLHIIYKVCLIYSVSNQFAFLSHYRYVFVTPCVSWVVSSSVSFCRKQRSKVPQWILKIIFCSKSRIDVKVISCLDRRFCF